MNKHVRDNSGFVLIAVLWIIATLSALASIYALYVHATVSGLEAYDRELNVEAAARAAVEVTALRILSTPEQLRPHSGEFELALGDTRLRARYASENCRVDLNAAPKELLEALFLASGAGDDAPTYAANVIAARSGAPGDPTRNVAPKLARKIRAPGELTSIANVPARVAEKAIPLSTAYTGNGKLDIFCASPQLLGLLPGLDRDRQPDILAALSMPVQDLGRLSSLLGRAQSFVTLESPKVYRVRIAAAFKSQTTAVSEIVIVLYKEGSEPYSVISWTDAAF